MRNTTTFSSLIVTSVSEREFRCEQENAIVVRRELKFELTRIARE